MSDGAGTGEFGPVGRAELARILRIDLTTVDRWRKNGCPCDTSSRPYRYPVDQVVEWLCDERAKRITAARAGSSPEREDAAALLDSYKMRRARADTELAELVLEEARGQIVPTDVVLEVLGAHVDRAKSRFLAFPGRYAARFVRIKTIPAMKKALQVAVREVLVELSNEAAIADHARAKSRGSRVVAKAARSRA